MKIDINTDLGEGFGRWTLGDDEALMQIVSSANVACGYHAGDAVIMSRMVELAKQNGVALGAHCGLPDLLGFGRVEMEIDPEVLQKHMLYQLGALAAIAKVGGMRVSHASGHGAMGMMQRRNPAYIEKTYDIFKAFDPEMIIAASVNTPGEAYAKKIGLRCVGKIFADRAYDDDGLLVSRKVPGSVIHDLETVQRRVERFCHDGTVEAMSGKRIRVNAQCILIHSDTSGAVEIARTVRDTIERGGGEVVPLDRLAA